MIPEEFHMVMVICYKVDIPMRCIKQQKYLAGAWNPIIVPFFVSEKTIPCRKRLCYIFVQGDMGWYGIVIGLFMDYGDIASIYIYIWDDLAWIILVVVILILPFRFRSTLSIPQPTVCPCPRRKLAYKKMLFFWLKANYKNQNWLVVSTPLNNINQLGWLLPINRKS